MNTESRLYRSPYIVLGPERSEGGVIVLPRNDLVVLVIPTPRDDVQVSVVVQITHR
jgi:hypothetical protein